VLALVCGALGWASLPAGGPVVLPAPMPEAVPPARLAPVPVLPAPAAGPWAEQVERPLFASDRRPPVAPAALPLAEPAAPEPPPPVAAAGVVLRPEGAVALLRLVDERVVRAAEGEEVEGWQLTRIGAEEVELTRGEQSVRLPARLRAAEGVLRY
jgi:hypothetical protein